MHGGGEEMNAYLMFPDMDFVTPAPPESDTNELVQDLELTRIFEAMAGGDRFVFDVVRTAVLSNLGDPETIRYRQAILRDCLNNRDLVREMYDLAVEAIAKEKKDFWHFSRSHPRWIVSQSIAVLGMFFGLLSKLKSIGENSAGRFRSNAFSRFFAMLTRELSDEYLNIVHKDLEQLAFHNGVLISAELSKGNKGSNYTLRENREAKQSWIDRLFVRGPAKFTLEIHPRDQAGHNALTEITDRGTNNIANVLGQSTEHILGFFRMLRSELAFYIGCINLHRQLEEFGVPVCFPVPADVGERKHSCEALYDVCLVLSQGRPVVDNDLSANGKDCVIITGANQGGKSTFLRSIGVAQMMMQCGMFVPARTFTANVCTGVFTHYKREEDVTMKSGKLDEELHRMSAIIDKVTANSVILFNESFAATNEREGSEIARQIVSALLTRGIKVFFVTHLYEFAHAFHAEGGNGSMFLRAVREPDGRRTFKLSEGAPLPTSFGADIYEKIFAAN